MTSYQFTPDPKEILLLTAFGFFQYMAAITHAELNLWLATITTVCAICKYGYDFSKWLKKRRNAHKAK